MVSTTTTINNTEMILVISLSAPYSLTEPDSNNGLFLAVKAFNTLSPLFDCRKHSIIKAIHNINTIICITVLNTPLKESE